MPVVFELQTETIRGGFGERNRVLANEVEESSGSRVEKSREAFWQFFNFFGDEKNVRNVVDARLVHRQCPNEDRNEEQYR